MPPPERVKARALDTLTEGVRTARLRLLLLLILLGTVTDVTPDLKPPCAESESPALDDGPRNGRSAQQPRRRAYARGVIPRLGSATRWFLNVGVRPMRTASIHLLDLLLQLLSTRLHHLACRLHIAPHRIAHAFPP